MFRKIRSIRKIGKGKTKIEADVWDTFQEYYNEHKKQRNLYILIKGEDYNLRVKELKFLQNSIENNRCVDGIKYRKNIYGDGNLGAMDIDEMKNIIREEYVTWPSN